MNNYVWGKAVKNTSRPGDTTTDNKKCAPANQKKLGILIALIYSSATSLVTLRACVENRFQQFGILKLGEIYIAY